MSVVENLLGGLTEFIAKNYVHNNFKWMITSYGVYVIELLVVMRFVIFNINNH